MVWKLNNGEQPAEESVRGSSIILAIKMAFL